MLHAGRGVCETSSPRGCRDLSEGLLSILSEHDVPAAVFVNSGVMAGVDDLLRPWQAAGVELGNHTATHYGIDRGSFHRWSEEVKLCGEALRRILGHAPAFFRHPYLRYGVDPQRRRAACRFLAEHGYTVAHTSAPTSDWWLAMQYRGALESGDERLAERLRGALISHVVSTLEAATAIARRCLGRDIRQILGLHVHRLAADGLGAVLAQLRHRGYRFVGLREALEDPVYRHPEVLRHHIGGSWLLGLESSRKRLGEPIEDWFHQEEVRLQQRFGSPTPPG